MHRARQPIILHNMRKKVLLLGGGFLLLTGILVAVLVVALARARLDAIEITAEVFAPEAGTYRIELSHGGRDRRYILHVPPLAASTAPMPLFLALHGGGGRAAQMDDLTHITAIADRERFLVAFPDAVDKNWNDGRTGVGSKAAKENIDDVGYIRAVIADVATRLPLDRKRVYAAGISNGAIMSSRLACESADVVAAVGLIVGTAPEGFEAWCKPARPVPVMAFLSTGDPLVPFNGGQITAFFPFIKRGRVVGADQLKQFWAEGNACPGAQTVEVLEDRTKADNSTVVRQAFSGCGGGADVVFYRLEGAGHTWPGGKQYLAPLLVGTTNRDIDASELLWQFFAAHPLP